MVALQRVEVTVQGKTEEATHPRVKIVLTEDKWANLGLWKRIKYGHCGKKARKKAILSEAYDLYGLKKKKPCPISEKEKECLGPRTRRAHIAKKNFKIRRRKGKENGHDAYCE